MNGSPFGQVLMINKGHDKNINQLNESLLAERIDVVCENDLGAAIHHAQKKRFDVIVLDANVQGMPIDRTIQILKDIDPTIKLIVKTDINSKELESKIRREAIYYYHLDSFGTDDLCLAIKSALSQKTKLDEARTTAQQSEIERKRILIVDEDDNFIDIHKTNLENNDYIVDVCYNADEAIKRILDKKPDLLMVDMSIPVGSEGLHFMEMLMSDNEMMRIPVMIFIARERMETYAKIMDRIKNSLPIWAYLEKPVKIENVIPKVHDLLNQKNLAANN